jgi:hypothetical protein
MGINRLDLIAIKLYIGTPARAGRVFAHTRSLPTATIAHERYPIHAAGANGASPCLVISFVSIRVFRG